MTKAKNCDVEIEYETFGSPNDESTLLIAGTGAQMLTWPEDFCRQLAGRGFHVIRFDNRDIGLSTRLTEAGRPNQLKMWLRPGSAAVYRLEDMADDAVAVMDALDRPAAHVIGFSLGGMVAQTLAIRHPDRVKTLTSISSTPAPRIGQPSPATLLKASKVVKTKKIRTRDDQGQYAVDMQLISGSPAYPADEAELRELGRQSYDRGGVDMAAIQRQTAAIVASGDRRADLARLQIPALILHGEEDRMIRPVAGRATADAIPGARLVTYPGMGHTLPRQLWTTMIAEIEALAERAVTAN